MAPGAASSTLLPGPLACFWKFLCLPSPPHLQISPWGLSPLLFGDSSPSWMTLESKRPVLRSPARPCQEVETDQRKYSRKST